LVDVTNAVAIAPNKTPWLRRPVGGIAQWLERRSLAGGLSLINA